MDSFRKYIEVDNPTVASINSSGTQSVAPNLPNILKQLEDAVDKIDPFGRESGVSGSPKYMSPEQISHDSDNADNLAHVALLFQNDARIGPVLSRSSSLFTRFLHAYYQFAAAMENVHTEAQVPVPRAMADYPSTPYINADMQGTANRKRILVDAATHANQQVSVLASVMQQAKGINVASLPDVQRQFSNMIRVWDYFISDYERSMPNVLRYLTSDTQQKLR